MPSKRRHEAVKDPSKFAQEPTVLTARLTAIDEIYKATKLNPNDSSRHAQVEDGDDDQEAGPAAPGDDEDFGPAVPPDGEDEAGEDDEGRFFGGGISKQESRILDYVDEVDEASKGPDKIDAAWLRKTVLNLEKRITKNAELRAKHEDDPQKFISSEADLDDDIKSLSVLSEYPALYPELVKLGSVASLVGLLAHDNTDIAIDVMELIGELTDEDVSATDEDWNALVDALLESDLIGLLVSNLSRLNEDDEADRNGVYYALGIVESLCSRAVTASRIAEDESLLRWLLQRAQRQEATVSQNKQYAAEIIAILAQASSENCTRLAEKDACDTMLQLVAPYRRRDPDKGSEEEEYMENLFEALTCLADYQDGKAKFLAAEGVELCLIMLKDGKMSKAPSLRLLDHAAASGPEVCAQIVDAGGLKPVFTLFNKTNDHRLLPHLASLFANMLRLLPSQSAERIRTLAKFVEREYEKTSKLVTLHADYSTRVRRAETSFQQEDLEAEAAEIELLSRRLDAGLSTLQQIDVTLAWLVAEDSGASKMIRQLLSQRDDDLSALAKVLREQQASLDTEDEESKDTSDMLGTLMKFLQ